jgi:nicotinate dehydrogenase subunit B
MDPTVPPASVQGPEAADSVETGLKPMPVPRTPRYGRVVRPGAGLFADPRARAWGAASPAGDGEPGAWAQGLAHAAAGGHDQDDIVAVAVRGRFVGVVAVNAAAAARAADRLRAQWAAPDTARHPDNSDTPSAPRIVACRGDAAGASGPTLARSYRWPAGQLARHVSDQQDPQCPATHAVAQVRDGQADVWVDSMGEADRARCAAEIAALLGLPRHAVRIHRRGEGDAAGPFDKTASSTADGTAARDAAADAALLAQATGQPVLVTLTAADLYDPSARDCIVSIEGRLTPLDGLGACTVAASAPWAHRPAQALLLTGMEAGLDTAQWGGDAGHGDRTDMADATAVPPYSIGDLYATRDTPARVATVPEAVLCHVFAHESYMDEVARSVGTDAVAFRLSHLHSDPRGAALVRSVAQRAQWWPRQAPPDGRAADGHAPFSNRRSVGNEDGAVDRDGKLRGRGFAYARVPGAAMQGTAATAMDGDTPTAAWSAWVADVEVDPANGEVAVTRLVVGQDIGAMQQAPLPSAGRADIMAATRTLLGGRAASGGPAASSSRPSGGAQAAARAAPIVDLVPSCASLPAAWQSAISSIPLAGTAAGPALLVAGPALTLPAAGALANAIHDATGIRLREPPFTAERVHAALQERARRALRRARAWWLGTVAAVAASAGVVATVLPWRAPIAPVDPPDPTLYSQQTLARGRLVAAAGNCVVCHTAQDGAPSAGGRAMETPFGTVYSSNITPDARTGIGQWSYAAFERAMRQGVSRDGHHLYPVFPYTSFTKLSDADMQALYAYLMAQPPVAAAVPPTRLRFPYARPLMAAWNALFLDSGSYRPDPAQSTLWNRGAYLVQGAGHCGACHTPRNAAGAEKKGAAFLSGGMVDGWEAPALNSRSKAPVPWTEDELYTYLRTGFSRAHGVAAGPMAPVVRQLALLPQEDVRAMAVYLASLNARAVSPATAQPLRPAMAPTGTGTATATATATDIATDIATATVTATPPATPAPGRDDRITGILTGAGAQIYQGACAACHDQGAGPQWFGVKPALPLNTSVHSASPDNLIQVILNGVPQPASPELGYMPGYKDVLSDGQVAELLTYLRATYAADQPAWQDLQGRVARLRATPYEYTQAVPTGPGENTDASAEGGH